METTIFLLPSKRTFLVLFTEDSHVVKFNITLSDIFNDDNYEFKYAIQDDFDRVLDLKVGEIHTMPFNRSDKNSIGLIKRIS